MLTAEGPAAGLLRRIAGKLADVRAGDKRLVAARRSE